MFHLSIGNPKLRYCDSQVLGLKAYAPMLRDSSSFCYLQIIIMVETGSPVSQAVLKLVMQ